jgi:hypothetical protein
MSHVILGCTGFWVAQRFSGICLSRLLYERVGIVLLNAANNVVEILVVEILRGGRRPAREHYGRSIC